MFPCLRDWSTFSTQCKRFGIFQWPAVVMADDDLKVVSTLCLLLFSRILA